MGFEFTAFIGSRRRTEEDVLTYAKFKYVTAKLKPSMMVGQDYLYDKLSPLQSHLSPDELHTVVAYLDGRSDRRQIAHPVAARLRTRWMLEAPQLPQPASPARQPRRAQDFRLPPSLSAAELDRLNAVTYTREPPASLTCPITMMLMQQPVTLDGRCFEMSALTQLVRNGRITSPVTNRSLPASSIEFNYSMRDVIEDWKQEHTI